ncbi:MAG: DNA primase [Tannerella sp.]|jgi:DNA primase|nr:DNA primase [Tannerella sp.]
MIDRATVDHILDAANIVEVVSDFVTLRRRGVNYIGLCPFHADKTPSFYVSPAKNICKCFACGEGGTAVHFIMKHEQLSYPDALRYLAKKYHIEIQERELSEEEKQAKGDRESMLIVNDWAQQYFTKTLLEHPDGSIGLRYFRERGFRDDTIRKFQLGYSLNERDALYQAAIKAGYKKEYLEKTGLVIAYEGGAVNDRFRGRVMFPVHTLSGKVVAFGGRVLLKEKDKHVAKYVNSPESEIYHKSNELYGIYFAKNAIAREKRCFLVEGYTDVISMHQAGIENVVASSGTALTHGQIRLIHRFTDNITVLYDGDAPGIKAAIRGIDLLIEDGMNVKVLLLPDGEDPDSFARKHNATEFAAFIKANETDFVRFKTKLLMDEAGNDPIKRAELISDIVRTVAIIPDAIARTVYIRECSEMMSIDEAVVLNEVNKIRLKQIDNGKLKMESLAKQAQARTNSGLQSHGEPPDKKTGDDTPAATFNSPFAKYELNLLHYVVRYGEQVLDEYTDEETKEEVVFPVAEFIRDQLTEDDMPLQTPLYRQMLDEAVAHCREAGFSASHYFLYHPDPEISALAAELVSDKYQLSKYHSKYREIKKENELLRQMVPYDLLNYKDAVIRARISQIGVRIKEAQGKPEEVIALMGKLNELNLYKKELNKRIGERIVLKM